MGRKSFLSRIDRSGNGTIKGSSNPTGKQMYDDLNKFLKVIFLTIADFLGIKPKGMSTGYHAKKRSKGKRKGRFGGLF